MTAKIRTEGAKTEGVLVGFGGVAAGIALYLDQGVPVFDYNVFEKHTVLKGKEPIAAGEATVEVDFAYQGEKPGGPAAVTLKVDGQPVAEGKMAATVAGRFGIDTFGIGEDTGQPVTDAYRSPFKFNGTIETVTITVK